MLHSLFTIEETYQIETYFFVFEIKIQKLIMYALSGFS